MSVRESDEDEREEEYSLTTTRDAQVFDTNLYTAFFCTDRFSPESLFLRSSILSLKANKRIHEQEKDIFVMPRDVSVTRSPHSFA